MRLTSTCVLVLSVFAFAGSAYAGNGNGNGNGNGGNSANAPGQQKKDAAPAAETTTTTSVTATVAVPSVPASEGVKPSNETAHDTHAEAQSSQTKEYGNGKTAGQIALGNGAKPTTVLHGPGNSQPHKASPCAGGHEVDVHALKGRRAGGCGGVAPTPDPVPAPVVVTTTPTVSKRPDPAAVPTRDPASSDPAAQDAGGETAGVVAESTADGHSQGVLAATRRIGRTASLPFTGRPLWGVVLLGLILIGTGLALREIRTAEACVESGHDHTDRSRHAAGGTRPPVGGRSSR